MGPRVVGASQHGTAQHSTAQTAEWLAKGVNSSTDYTFNINVKKSSGIKVVPLGRRSNSSRIIMVFNINVKNG